MKLFREDDFISLYKKIMKDGYNSKGAGDMWEPSTRNTDIVEIANDIFQKWLDDAPTVYASEKTKIEWGWTEHKAASDTRSAKLVCIEEIKKDCKHEPLEEVKHTVCKHCGVHLDAEWKVK